MESECIRAFVRVENTGGRFSRYKICNNMTLTADERCSGEYNNEDIEIESRV